jgi:hypothetical protein
VDPNLPPPPEPETVEAAEAAPEKAPEPIPEPVAAVEVSGPELEPPAEPVPVEPDAMAEEPMLEEPALAEPEVAEEAMLEEPAPTEAEPVVDAEAESLGPSLAGLFDPCDANCVPGLLCMFQADGTRRCEIQPDGVCLVCETPDECPTPGAECLTFPDGSKHCGSPCGSNFDCPKDYGCIGEQCRPKLNACACDEALDGQVMACTNQTASGTCTGYVLCQAGTWTNCSAKLPSTEICDGKDNNCDGITDESPLYMEAGEAKGFGYPCGLGACEGGGVVCDDSGGVTCSSLDLASLELCADQTDNDCDGLTNEGCMSTDYDGDGVPNQADCRPADAAYHAGADEPCCDPALGNDASCDQNCDGQATPCAACDGDWDGFCAPEDCNDADPLTHPGAPEKCQDGIDQDCLGGDLLCPVVKDVDKDGFISPADCVEGNPSINPWADEGCDNLDNDCDGVTDEGNPGGGPVCGIGEEYCEPGLMICTHYGYGAFVQCQGAMKFGPERCDGLDNDCNGATDEAFPKVGTPCDGLDGDLCAYGSWHCTEDGLGTACSETDGAEESEVCNNLDDDCDGATDEFVCPIDDLDGDGLSPEQADCDDLRAEVHPGALEPCCDPDLGPAGQVVCDWDCDEIVFPCALADKDADGFTPGQGDCAEDDPKRYPEAPEKCGDGVDQDCNGQDTSCTLVQDNDNDTYGADVDCNDSVQTIHPGAIETCNYVDDDCDGVIDDGNPTQKVGGCGPETAECLPAEWACVHDPKTYTFEVVCVTPKFQVQETCDEADNDCDGETDEAFAELGLACDGPDVDACLYGTYGCAEDGLGVSCGEESSVDLAEICDAEDNDCDGEPDEDLAWHGVPLGAICDGVGQCGKGVVVCSAAFAPTCSSNPDGPFPQAKTEACNGQDDDCDGLTDEGFAYQDLAVGAECDGIGSCGPGLVECGQNGATTCSTNEDGSASQVTPEQCNGQDDDCDEAIDEAIDPSLATCPKLGVCAAGTVGASCVDGQWACEFGMTAPYEPTELSCDGLDNDCNGVTDEGFGVGQPCDGTDSDQCAHGVGACGEDQLSAVCESEDPAGILETCDGLDNDCNGVTDDGVVSPQEAGCLGQGVCAIADQVSVLCGSEGGYLCDYAQVHGYQLSETRCDYLDNNCDGETDEAMAWEGVPLGGACDGTGGCGAGSVECHPTLYAAICSTNPGGSTDESVEETCNGADDDCDAATDEDLPLGPRCDSPSDTDDCETGQQQCVGGQMECAGDVACVIGPGSQCQDFGTSQPEVCYCGIYPDCQVTVADACDQDAPVACTCNGGLQCKQGTVCALGVGCVVP